MNARAKLLGRALLVAAILLASLLGAAPSAHADPRAAPTAASREDPRLRASAAELKQRGDTLLTNKRFEEALAAYEQSYALSPNPAIDYNRGRALQFLARYPEALRAIERFAVEAPAELKRRVAGLPELLAELRSRVSTVDIRCAVAGARVVIDNKVVATTPVDKPLAVNAGRAVVEVFADGYFPFRAQLTLPRGGTLAVDVPLASRDTMGYLVIKSSVAGARVQVDGKDVGVVPTEVALPSGTHPVRVAREGYETVNSQVVLAAGELRDLDVPLPKATPLVARWWFWAAIGSVVATTAVVVIATQTERAPPSGDFSPGQVRF